MDLKEQDNFFFVFKHVVIFFLLFGHAEVKIFLVPLLCNH